MAQDKFFRTNYTINCGGELIDLSQPSVMGIVNVTPDSFYGNSRAQSDSELVDRSGQLLEEGAAFLDLGAYSTRPDAAEVTEQEEIDRMVPAVEAIVKAFPKAILSIDTFRSEVAKAAIHAGGHIVNDVAGGTLDENMFETVAQLQVPYILMHMRGTPKTMQQLTDYENLTQDITFDLAAKVQHLRKIGVNDVIIDLGFGFAKSTAQNYELMHNLEHFHMLDCPILVGISRKSMIYKPLNISPEKALHGTTVLNTIAIQKGAHILRVHDVEAAAHVIQIMHQMAEIS